MRADFRLEDWIVSPRRGYIKRDNEIVHIHPKPMAVLECLAKARGEVLTRYEVFETVWPDVIVSDDALAQCVVELRKAFGDSASDSKIIRTIPKVGYCLIPPVTALTDARSATSSRRRLMTFGVLAMVVAIGVLYQVAMVEEEPPALVTDREALASIAVLPFVNRSLQAEDEYFSDGIHDELLTRLSQISGLRVISRTSVNQYRDTDKTMPEIAGELSVDTILEGSVQREANQVRINVQLIDARSDTHLWSKTYDSERINIFVVQDEISAAIVAAMKEHLGVDLETGSQMPTTVIAEAHDAYLRGKYLVAKRTSADVESAVNEFERAVALDPNYAIAHAELAMAITFAGGDYFQVLPWDVAAVRAQTHADRAKALNPDLAEAHAALGLLAWMNGAFDGALTAFTKALQSNPNYSEVHSWMATVSARVGRYKDILPHQQRALRLDPVSVLAMNNYVHSLIEHGCLDEATLELEKIRSIAPRIYADYQGRVKSVGGKWAYLVLGGLDELRIIPGDLRARGLLSWGFLMIGLEQEASAIIDTPNPEWLLVLGRPLEAIAAAEALLTESERNNVFARRSLGMAYATAGEYKKARPLLEDGWQQSGERITMGGFGLGNAAALITIRRDAGDDSGVAELLVAIQDDIRRLREAGFVTTHYMSTDYEEGLASYLAGERNKGLSLIARASEDGYFIWPKTAFLKELFEDPRFAPILENQAARQSRENQRFLNLVCNSNPYESFWQPAEGTCERFAAKAAD
ncbi:MAG: winged helix-turn-helix domain-containing protein [Xanthomonadales bacterium]|nr:winged helix-turn-helix domain-containing protein [Xanthomonadales bacterium]